MNGTVLIVDDTPAGQIALEGLLISEGYQLGFAGSGAEALEKAAELLPDVILLDVMMPVMDGYEVCRRLRADARLCEVPIILVTALDDRDSKLQGLEAGADDFISKPFDRIELKARVRAIMRLNRYRRLVQERAKFERVIELSPNGIMIISENGQIQLVNPALLQLLGYPEQQLLGRVWPEIVAGQQREFCQQQLAGVIDGREKQRYFETEFLRADNQQIAVEINAGNLIWENRSAAQIVVRDITARQRAEQQLREQAALLDKTQDAIIVQDLSDQILFWNVGATKIYGWSNAQAIGKDAAKLLFKSLPMLYLEARRLVRNRGEWIGELEQITSQSRSIIVQSRWTLVCDDNGQPTSTMIVNTDITEKKRLEEQFFRAQRMESIGTLASGIAHDLNNVLTPIMMSTQILKTKVTDDRGIKILAAMEDVTKRGADLIRQVLSFGRGLEGKPTMMQLKHLILEVEKITKETFPRSIELSIELPVNLWIISADATQIHQLLMNFCVNARDAMPAGGKLTIAAENFYVDENYAHMNINARVGPYVVITITDTGMGIPSEIQERIFEPFFTTKAVGQGTGLGLSTVISIVKGHEGFLTVYSEVGKGSQFKIYLPALENAETARHNNIQIALPGGDGRLVLIVDDEAAIREITRVTLEAYNYRTLTAADGTEAIALYVQHRHEIEIVLTDMMMPVMDGATTIRAISHINPNIKVIAMSGIVTEDKIAEAQRSGAQAMLAKPFTAEELLTALSKVAG